MCPSPKQEQLIPVLSVLEDENATKLRVEKVTQLCVLH